MLLHCGSGKVLPAMCATGEAILSLPSKNGRAAIFFPAGDKPGIETNSIKDRKEEPRRSCFQAALEMNRQF